MIEGLLIACGTAILYILVGYPVLVLILSTLRPRPVRPAPIRKSVTIIVPVHNGGHYLTEKLESLMRLDYPRELLEIIVASDGSTDNTVPVAERFAVHGVRALSLPRRGKCAALNAAIAVAHGEILLLTDVRQVVEPASLAYLLENYADSAVGAASGELILIDGTGSEAAIGAYWRFESWLRDSLAKIDSMLGATGPFYTIRRELAVVIPEHILLDDMYLPLKGAFLRGYRLVVDRRARSYDPLMPLQVEFQRKVRTLAGNYQLLVELPAMLTFRNRMWIHYVSYKIGRLALPWLLIAFFMLSLFAPPGVRLSLVILQTTFYALAASHPFVPKGWRLKRLSGAAHSFVTMMIAAVLAVKVFFVRPQDMWKVTSAHSSSGQGAESLAK